MTNEAKFLEALKNVFVGAKVDGDSGYINLMRIKARYFEQGVFPRLITDIEAALRPFPEFREELFDRLYTFFHRYFSESGAIYFRYTPLHERVYEQVYTDDRDVMLFWKTHMLYYVKTDRLFQSMEVEVDGRLFYFDVSALEHKRANEKRALVYEFREKRADGALVFGVTYSERGRQSSLDDIRKALRQVVVQVGEETLEQAFRLFERQSEVDYFINQDARAFLRGQFDLWLYQYIFKGETQWTEKRIRQLQALKDIAIRIIDFIAQFEDELVRIWNKPKFVLDSHYVITLDRIVARDIGLLRRLLGERLDSHCRDAEGAEEGEAGGIRRELRASAVNTGIAAQLAEWRELGMVDVAFTPADVWQKDLLGERLHPCYRYLPVDTRYFPDLEPDLLALFDHLDQELDGWLIKSENYQALNTLLPKFRERVKCIYIDPPYNRPDQSEILYVINYKRSSWLSLMSSRLDLATSYLDERGVLLCAIDDHEFADLVELVSRIFQDYSLYHIVVNHHPQGSSRANVAMTHEYMLFVVPEGENLLRGRAKNGAQELRSFMRSGSAVNNFRRGRPNSFYAVLIDSENGQVKGLEKPPIGQDYPRESTEDGLIRIYPIGGDGSERVWRWSYESALARLGKIKCMQSKPGSFGLYQVVDTDGKYSPVTSNWIDKKYNAGTYGTNLLSDLFGEVVFDYPKSVFTVMDAIKAVGSEDSGLVFDFFAGSGTAAHAVINLNRQDGGQRKYILVEMADYFDTVLLPRVKKAVFSDVWKDGQAQAGQGVSHFIKYFHLEQYEDVLRRARYEDAEPLFIQADPYSQYVFLRDKKMLDNAQTGQRVLEVDTEKEEVRVHLSNLYDGIDLAETLSCVSGKWIRRITREEVEFADGQKASLVNPLWERVKPLIWW